MRGGAGRFEATEAAGPETTLCIRCTPAVRERWSVARDVAERVAGERLREADALEHATAEALSGMTLDGAAAAMLDEEPPARRRAPEPAAAARAPGEEGAARLRAPARALPREVEELARGLDDASAFELDRRLRCALRLEQRLEARMAPLLRVVACREHEWSDRWRPVSEYAPDELGFSATKARALLRLERGGELVPALREAYRSGRLSWVKAQTLLPLLLLDLEGEGGADWRPAWITWAERVTVRRLEADVERALLLRAGSDLGFRRCQHHPERAQDPLPEGERQTCAHDADPEETEELVFRVPFEVAALFRAAREALRARLRREPGRTPTDGEAFSALLDRALRTWLKRYPGKRRRNPVIERDGYRCAVPGCTSRRSLHDHHVIFRSHSGSDDPANRVTLCAFHHQRCLHARRLRIRGEAPDDLVFELGLRAGGPPLARYRSGEVALPLEPGEERPPAPSRAARARARGRARPGTLPP